jgi:transcriptional regulator with XRE-family HTH domain
MVTIVYRSKVLVELGRKLRTVRQLRRLSLAGVAQRAKISATYIQKLEAGVVGNPSPRVLQHLAEVLDVSYTNLMELAGYLVPGSEPAVVGQGGLVEQALRNEELTEEEQRAVVAFIAYLKDHRPKI